MNLVERVALRKLNLLFKLVAGSALVLVALSLKSFYYNLAVIVGILAVVIGQRIRLLRFRSLYLSMAFFLFLLFLFRLFPGYGKVLWEVPGFFTLTSGGIHQAALSVEMILLVFLVYGAGLYSASREEISYYLRKIPGESNRFLGFISRMGQIGLFALFLLPVIFDEAKGWRSEIAPPQAPKKGWKSGLKRLGERLGGFFVAVLKRAEDEYPRFREETERTPFEPLPLRNWRHLTAALFLIGIHSVIWWVK